jgi:polyisoprenoid-binding protein YceI
MRIALSLFGSLGVITLASAALMYSGLAGSAASAETAREALDQPSGTHRIDAVHSSVIFSIKHMGIATFYGRFNQIGGTVNWNPNDPANSSFVLEIPVASVDTNNNGRDRHLRSPDFFNEDEFSTITFRSTRIEKTGDNAYRVAGNLNLHGVERPLTVDLKQTGETTHPRSGNKLVGLETTFTIKRTDFRMNYGVEQGALGDEVGLIIALEIIEN